MDGCVWQQPGWGQGNGAWSVFQDEASVPRLLRIEGRHAVRVTQVTTQPVCIDDGAVGDTFVL